MRQKEKNEKILFYEKVLNNTVTIKKISEDMDSMTANMERVIKSSLEGRIAKIEDNINTILFLLQKK